MSTTIDEDYIENLSFEILDWCETLVEKGKFEFKQSECKEKFVVVMEGKVVKACEILCTKSKIQQDPSSRRIIVYKIDSEVIAKAEQKAAERKAAAAAVAVPVPKKVPLTKVDKVKSVLSSITEPKKVKATDSVASVKKQKISDTTGVKKISSYFAVQPKQSLTTPASSDENTEPSSKSVNSSVSSHGTQGTAATSAKVNEKPPVMSLVKPVYCAPKPMFIVEDFSPYKPDPVYEVAASTISGNTISEDMMNRVCKLILDEADRRLQCGGDDDTLDVSQLLVQLEGGELAEAQLREVLAGLEGENKIMLDGDTIYVV